LPDSFSGRPADDDRIARFLLNQAPEVLQLVILSRSAALRRWEQPGRRVVVDLEDQGYLDDAGLHVNVPPLLERLALDPPKPSIEVEAAPDGAWLQVNGHELQVRQGKQRDFILVMANAYRSNHRRPKLEWVLRQAGYAEGTSELKHVSKRPEFLEFFGYGNGEVWINDTLPWPDEGG
jgi:hypothetical protein